MKNKFILFIFFFPLALHAQFNAPANGELFRDDVVPRIDIYLAADSLDWILDDSNQESNHLFNIDFIFNNGTLIDTLENVGFRLRGNTSRQADKKSFKIDFNAFSPGRKFDGVEKMNLNGQHNDPSISRAKIAADFARNLGIPSLRTNHVAFYINDAFHGVYLNVEHIDEEYVEKRFGNNHGNLYKCLWPADLDYKGEESELYKEEFFGRRAYTLQINEEEDNYDDLAHFIDVLNNTTISQLPCELEPIFNVDQYLQFIVFDILTGNWDGPIYNKNNFYLYHNQATGKFEYIPFDLDNTLGIDWIDRDWGTRDIYSWNRTGHARPIYTKIISVPKYRSRFSYYMNEAINNHFNETQLFPYLNNMRNQISNLVQQDTFYQKDYGFSHSNFITSFDNPLPYEQVEDYGIKTYISARKNSALSQLNLNYAPPILTNIQHNYPSENDDIIITAKIVDGQNINQVELCYTINNNTTCLAMFDDGMHEDGVLGDSIYGIIIPALNQIVELEFTITATDGNNQSCTEPSCGANIIYIDDNDISLAVNEIMASNNSYLQDEFGEYDDWIEIYNYGTNTIFLGNKYLSDNVSNPNKWKLPNITILPGEYLIFWADNDIGQGIMHTNFKLSSNGEFIGIFKQQESNFELIDGFNFDALGSDISLGRIPNGIGNLDIIASSAGSSNFPVSNENINQSNIHFHISPNPANEVLFLEHSDMESETNVYITDMLGRILFIKTISDNGQEEIDIQNLSSGIHIISIKEKGRRIYSQKFIKK